MSFSVFLSQFSVILLMCINATLIATLMYINVSVSCMCCACALLLYFVYVYM